MASSTELASLLQANTVPTEMVAILQAAPYNLQSIRQLANAFESVSDVRTSFWERQTEERRNSWGQAALVGLRQAWREAEASTASLLRSVSAGLPEENLEDSLRAAVAQDLRKDFRSTHSFTPPSAWMGPPTLLGRLHREFSKYTHVFFPLRKVRSQELSDVLGPAVHTVRLSNEIEVRLPGDASATKHRELPVNSCNSYLMALRIL
eukprot:6462396-Amphidinium_carterae.1